MNLKSFSLVLIAAGFSFSISAQSITDSLHPIQLNCVGISWTRPSGEECFSVTNLDEGEVKKNVGNGSVNNLFDLVPSMVTTSDAGTGIGYTYMRIRGIDQTRINVTLNGIAINDAESQGSWLVNLPDLGGKTRNLEIQRGIGTSNNGAAAFGASMNFSTLETANEPFLEFSSAAGSFYTFRNSIAASTGLINKRLSATAAYSNILSRGYVERASAELHSFYFAARYKMLSKDEEKNFGTLKFNLLYGKEKTGLAWNGVSPDSLATHRRYNSCGEYVDDNGNIAYYYNETDNYRQTHFQLFYESRHQPTGLQYDFGLHLTRGIGYYEEYQDNMNFSDLGFSPLIIQQDTFPASDFITRKYLDNYFYGFNFHIKQDIDKSISVDGKRISRHWTWSIGGDVKRYDGKYYGTLVWAERGENLHLDQHWHDGTGVKNMGNLFGTLAFQSDHLYSYIDLQYRLIDYTIGGTDEELRDVDLHFLWHFFNPKLGMNYEWHDARHATLRHSVYTTLAMSHREPTRSDLREAVPDRRPVPERLYDWELGYRLRGSKFNFNANGYFMYYDNQLVLTGEINSEGAAVMTNVKKSFRLGIELVANYQPVKWFHWACNATFSLNRILDFEEFVDDWDNGGQRQQTAGTTAIAFSPAVVASNALTFNPIKGFAIAWITKGVSKQYLDNSQDEKHIIKPYCTNDLHFSYTLHTKAIEEIGFFFQVNNIFNRQYSSNGWLYKYLMNNETNYMTGYYVQAGINFIGGIRLRF